MKNANTLIALILFVLLSSNVSAAQDPTFKVYAPLVGVAPQPQAAPGQYIETVIDLVGQSPSEWSALRPWTSTSWTAGGSAFTANARIFYFDVGLKHAALAVWSIVVNWNNCSACRIRLVAFVPGVYNYQELAVISGENWDSPVPRAAVITDKFNVLVDARIQKALMHQFITPTSNPPVVFASSLVIVW